MAEHEDEGVHVRVDVAEHPHDAGPVEPYGLGVPRRVTTEVELSGLREREHVVVDPIAVWEIDDRAGRDRQHVRDEPLAALVHDRTGSLDLFESAPRRGIEVDDRLQTIRDIEGCGRRPEFGDGWTTLGGRRPASQFHTPGDRPVPSAAYHPVWRQEAHQRCDDDEKGPRSRCPPSSGAPRFRSHSCASQNQNCTWTAASVARVTRPPLRVFRWHDAFTSRFRWM